MPCSTATPRHRRLSLPLLLVTQILPLRLSRGLGGQELRRLLADMTPRVADDRQVDSCTGPAQRRHVANCHVLAGCVGTRLRSEFEYEMLMTTHDSFPTGQV